MKKFKKLIIETKKGITKVILNRPEVLNAIDDELLNELRTALVELQGDPKTRAMILTGAGRAFCTGIDLNYARKILQSGMETSTYIMNVQEIFRLEKLEKPIVSAINGYALGEGCDLAVACDFRIASTEAKMGMTYIKLGFAPPPRAIYRLIQLVGMAKAEELLLFGDTIEAEEALKIRLVNKVVPPEKLDSTVLDLAERLAKGAPLALGLTKKGINAMFETVVRGSADFYLRILGECYESGDAREGVEARIAKREPTFKGR